MSVRDLAHFGKVFVLASAGDDEGGSYSISCEFVDSTESAESDESVLPENRSHFGRYQTDLSAIIRLTIEKNS